jgi:hypothetical protein
VVVHAGEVHYDEIRSVRRGARHRVSSEEIARLSGHATTRTIEIVYRRELRSVITTGAEIMDQLFTAISPPRVGRHRRPWSMAHRDLLAYMHHRTGG